MKKHLSNQEQIKYYQENINLLGDGFHFSHDDPLVIRYISHLRFCRMILYKRILKKI
jgi:hypothetical protein